MFLHPVVILAATCTKAPDKKISLVCAAVANTHRMVLAHWDEEN
jgi:hypothetical protein